MHNTGHGEPVGQMFVQGVGMKLIMIVVIGLVVLLVGGGARNVQDHERLVIYSMGEFKRLSGPGWVGTWPVLEYGKVIRIGESGVYQQEGLADFSGYAVPVAGPALDKGRQVTVAAFREGKIWVVPAQPAAP